MQTKKTILLVNFGGPRSLSEVEPFLKELLTDREVIRTPFPQFIHNLIFRRTAKKRAKIVTHDYAGIGGKSPIYEDTEWVKSSLAEISGASILTFHRYLPETHNEFIATISKLQEDEIIVFPFFPQFSYATTGSIAKWFCDHLPEQVVGKLRWIRSYCSHKEYISCSQTLLSEFLRENQLNEEESLLLFSAHGLPQVFIDTGDIYESECQLSFTEISKAFPKAKSVLAYQSKFGRGKWLEPSTEGVCEGILGLAENRKNVVVIPLSFTSDHIETLFEIEKLYLPIIETQGLNAYRCPALGRREDWIQTIGKILEGGNYSSTAALLRKKSALFR